MHLRLIYASQATTDFSPEQLVDLLATSRSNNDRDGLSGMLLYSSQSFLQLLEGDDEVLRSAFDRISADDRHENVRILMQAEAPGPMFPDWNMGFEHIDEDDLAENVPGYTPATDYPLVNPDLVVHAGVAQTLFKLYAKNRVR